MKIVETVWDSQDAIRRNTTIHRVNISGLQSDTEYAYEVVVLNPRSGKIEIISKGSFKTFPAQKADSKIMIISDTQCDGHIRQAMIDKMLNIYGGKAADFFFALGDMSEGFANFRHEYFSNFYDRFPANKYFKPVFFVRGNHEFRGQESRKYNEYFGKSYYAFRHGDTFFFILESGEDKPTIYRPGHYTLNIDANYYFAEQREWLRKIIETPECKTAKHRIVLTHGTPFHSLNGYFSKNIESMAGEFFYGKNPKCQIDLWISAHTHSPFMYDPAAGKFYMANYSLSYDKKAGKVLEVPIIRKKPLVFKEQDLKNLHFPVIVNDGPGGSGVHLSAMLIETNQKNIRVKMLPVSETYSTYSDKEVKKPILDVILERGKPITINSTTLKAI